MEILRLRYFFQTAWAAVVRAKGMAWLNAASVSVALVMVGTYVMGVANLERLTVIWGHASKMSCVLDEHLTQQGWQNILQQICGLTDVQGAHLVSPEAALARFAARSPDAAALVAGVDPEILPPTVEVSVQGEDVDVQKVHRLEAALLGVVGVTSVDFGSTEVDQLRRFVQQLRWGGFAIGGALALAMIVLLSNTIRLTVYARREELVILRLVGATPLFVCMPFLLEGALWGLGGGLLGILELYGLHYLAAARLTHALAHLTGGFELRFFVGQLAVALLLAGLLLGICGSALALRRFLDTEAT